MRAGGAFSTDAEPFAPPLFNVLQWFNMLNLGKTPEAMKKLQVGAAAALQLGTAGRQLSAAQVQRITAGGRNRVRSPLHRQFDPWSMASHTSWRPAPRMPALPPCLKCIAPLPPCLPADKRDPQRPPGHDCVPGLRGAGRDDAEGPLRQPAGAPGGLQRVLWCMKFGRGAFSM